MTDDTPVCAICLEPDEKEKLIVLHEKFEHYIHARCYSRKTIGMTCPFCTKPFSSQQSRELLDTDLRDVFDKQQALSKNLKDENYEAIKDCVCDQRIEKHAIIDAFSLEFDVITVIDVEKASRLEIFLVCAVASEDLALISLAHYCLFSRNGHYRYHVIAIEVCVMFRLFKVLKFLAAHDFKLDEPTFKGLIKMLCRDNDIEAVRNLINVYPNLTRLSDPHIFADAITDEMADFLLTAWSETIFNNNSMWKTLDFNCFLSRCISEDTPFVRAWDKIRAAGYKGKLLPSPYDVGEYRKRIRID